MIRRFHQLNENVDTFRTNMEDYFIDFLDDGMLTIEKNSNKYILKFNFKLNGDVLDQFINSAKYIQKIKTSITRLKLEYPNISIEYDKSINFYKDDNYAIEIINTSFDYAKFQITKKKFDELTENKKSFDNNYIISIFDIIEKLGIIYCVSGRSEDNDYIFRDESNRINLRKKIKNIEIYYAEYTLDINGYEPIFDICTSDDNDFLVFERYYYYDSGKVIRSGYYKVDKKSIENFIKEKCLFLMEFYKLID